MCPSEMEGDVFPAEALDPEFGELMQRTFQAACLEIDAAIMLTPEQRR